MKEIYFSDLNLEELESLCRNANNELIRRRVQERKNDWNEVVAALKAYIKKYGDIVIDCGCEDFILDEEADFPANGIIHPALYD